MPVTHQPDPAAETLFLQGDKSAFEQLFRAYYSRLVHYAFKVLGDQDEAEEMVQQVFISLWETRQKMSIHSSLKSYLYRAVHNRCLNLIEKNAVRQQYQQEVRATTDESVQPLQQLAHTELEKEMKRALDKLPEQCRRVFELSRYEGLKYAAIAEVLGISVKTVENQVGKALKILREELKEYLVVLVMILLNNYLD